MPNMSQLAAPLRQLLEKDVLWHWTNVHNEAFMKLKTVITQTPVLQFFDVSKPVTLSVDASSKGMGAVIMQEGPVAYASKALTECQQRYSQIEKEMLAIVFSCEKFREYLCGQEKITVETDHKPLESILKKLIISAPPRLQQMIMKIQCYPLVVQYKPGSQLFIADALSRAYMSNTEPSTDDEYEICLLAVEGHISEEKLNRIILETECDRTLQTLKSLILNGWPEDNAKIPKEYRDYSNYKDELGLQDGVLLKGDRIIIPASLREEITQKTPQRPPGSRENKSTSKSSSILAKN